MGSIENEVNGGGRQHAAFLFPGLPLAEWAFVVFPFMTEEECDQEEGEEERPYDMHKLGVDRCWQLGASVWKKCVSSELVVPLEIE